MVFKFLRGEGGERLAAVEAKVHRMLDNDRREFDLAVSALLGDAAAEDVNVALRRADQEVNRLEREIRRELVVHTSVFGGIDTPAVLVYMSVVKDIERVGDYAKNLIDLALDGADFSTLPDAAEWRRLAADVSAFMLAAGEVFRTHDAERGREVRQRGDDLLTVFDQHVSALVRGEDQDPQPVSRALAYRYLKRVVAHLMNMVSGVTMSVDKLDYYDEDPEDRAPL